MSRILGLDLGTNSIGWGIVDENNDGTYKLFDKGVTIFQEGVKIEKGIESSKAADRTTHRHSRRHYFRRKLRKIEVIKVLVENDLCPQLTKEQLDDWRYKRVYPLVEEFILWQRTSDNEEKNPYHDRYICLTEKLNLSAKKDRYILGRALYHLAQRRGFLSNRLEKTKESDGAVKQGIQDLNKLIQESGCKYLGEYFYSLYGKERIRNRYTAREEYREEFEAICLKQGLPEELKEKLYRAIFFQRPLKSQKGTVGRCKFETNKARIPVSHPSFELFRMYSFINNIKIKTPDDNELRPLKESEKEQVFPLFFRKSKKSFTFEDIAKAFTKKGSYAFYKDDEAVYKPFVFNYPMYQSVSGCPVIAQIKSVLGEDWEDYLLNNYLLKANKTKDQIINDVWHVLFSFDSDEKIIQWAIKNLKLDEEKAKSFADISVPQEYASLSLKAINKMLPYLQRGLIYSHAVFLANMQNVLPAEIWNNAGNRRIIEDEIIKLINDDRSIEGSIEARLEEFLRDNFDVSKAKFENLYHPSKMDVFEKIPYGAPLKLGSPRTNSVRNPMAMRALFRLRILINQLLADGEIDRQTKIHIEFARELNDANKRKAIEQYQREREKENEDYRNKIKEVYSQNGISREPSKVDIQKYRLWEEQGHICLYTGDKISLIDFLGSNPKYDIEHTIPRSIGGEDALENKTLCRCDFNRDVKKNQLPQSLANVKEILSRIEQNAIYSPDRIRELQLQIEKYKAGGYSSKEVKDRVIQKRRRLEIEEAYLYSKYRKFLIKDLKEGYRKNQDIDNSIISKYGREYLKTLFNSVYTIKGYTTSEFRKLWGIQEDEKKDRSKYSNHTVDAVVVACIGPKEYQQMAHYYHKYDEYTWYGKERPSTEKPWSTFTEDIKEIDKDILVYHYTPDNTIKPTFKKLRKKGIIQKIDGKTKFARGDSARAQLHMETFYGAVKKDDEIKYVVRKPLSSLDQKDIKNIVDDMVKQKVEEAIEEYGLKQALAGGKVWMNKEKGIEIKKVRLFVPSVTNPINLKKQRDLSRFDYKQSFFVANDSNYCIAIYEGEKNGKIKRDFEIVNNLDAVALSKDGSNSIIPDRKNGYLLKNLLKVGTMVLLYENTPEEIYESDQSNLSKRLYKVIGFSTLNVSANSYGRIYFKHHMDARSSTELKAQNGAYKSNEELRPYIMLLSTQINALCEGQDFILSPTGHIKFLNR